MLDRAILLGSRRAKFVKAELIVRNAVKEDLGTAFRLARAAASCGEGDAALLVGWMLMHGYGVQRNTVVARDDLCRAASAGIDGARELLGDCPLP